MSDKQLIIILNIILTTSLVTGKATSLISFYRLTINGFISQKVNANNKLAFMAIEADVLSGLSHSLALSPSPL